MKKMIFSKKQEKVYLIEKKYENGKEDSNIILEISCKSEKQFNYIKYNIVDWSRQVLEYNKK